jgi:Cof subfamily protein (haloacid dehalogenase superfamily)
LAERPSYGLLVSDIDGTLVGEDKVVPPGVIAAVKAAQARGVRVCLATGRMWETARPFVEVLGADPPVILFNGGLVYDFAADRTLWIRRIPRDIAAQILTVLPHFPQVSPLVFLPGKVFALRKTPLVDRFARRDRLRIHIAPEVPALLTADPMKFLIVGDRPDLEALSRALARLEEPPNQVFSQTDYLEILPKDANKGVALSILTEAVGTPLARTVAVGDNLNDQALLQTAGLGIAVEGAPPELLAVAAWVCPPPEQEGLRVVIERIWLSGGLSAAGRQ